jgi:L-threonylcarbamoyladenylate synthase
VAGVAIENPTAHSVAVSGNVQDHYQPKTPLHLVTVSELAVQMEENSPDHAYVSIGCFEPSKTDHLHVSMPTNPQAYAQLLYQTLHELDKHNPKVIWCEIPVGDQWETILDRLQKASSNF